MRGRVIILIGAIVVLAIVAVVFLMTSSDSGTDEGRDIEGTPVIEETPEIPPPQIVVAIQDLPRGLKIPENGVGIVDWPKDALPEEGNYFKATEITDVIGLYARTDIPRGAPILVRHVVQDLADISAVGSDAAAVMNSRPPGTVAVAIPLDPSGVGQAAYAIQDGDSVDVILSFLFVDVDPTFQTRMPNNVSLITRLETGELSIGAPRQGRTEASTLSPEGILLGPSEPSQRPRLVTQRTVTNAWVIHVGPFPPNGDFIGVPPTPTGEPTSAAPPGEGEQQQQQQQQAPAATATPFAPWIMTLAVTPQEALVLVWAIDAQIPISLALRQAGDTTQEDTVPVTLDYMISTYNAAPPNALEFALEPPITSVRRFDIETLYDFLGTPSGQ
jgi:Flp pilus assembly protein CpaB